MYFTKPLLCIKDVYFTKPLLYSKDVYFTKPLLYSKDVYFTKPLLYSKGVGGATLILPQKKKAFASNKLIYCKCPYLRDSIAYKS